MLQPLLALGKPVANTEFGMRSYQGAASEGGALGFGVADQLRVGLHQLPVVGRFVRERLNVDYVRDEAMQARQLTETLTMLEARTSTAPSSTSSSPPRPRSATNPVTTST